MYKYFVFLLLLNYQFSFAQEKKTVDFKKDFQYHITATTDEIIIDGQLKEAIWNSVEVGSDFWQKIPYYTEGADPKTKIKLAYGDKYLYV